MYMLLLFQLFGFWLNSAVVFLCDEEWGSKQAKVKIEMGNKKSRTHLI